MFEYIFTPDNPPGEINTSDFCSNIQEIKQETISQTQECIHRRSTYPNGFILEVEQYDKKIIFRTNWELNRPKMVISPYFNRNLIFCLCYTGTFFKELQVTANSLEFFSYRHKLLINLFHHLTSPPSLLLVNLFHISYNLSTGHCHVRVLKKGVFYEI